MAVKAGTPPQVVLCDDNGIPITVSAGALSTTGGGGGGGGAVTVADGADVAQGTTTDAATVNTVIGRLKKLISLLPTALGATGGLVVEGVASGVAQPVSGTVTANAGIGPFPVSDNSGSLTVDSVDGGQVTIGTTTDAAATGNGTVVGIIKQLRVLLNGGLPAALAANGGLKVEGVASGVAVPISGTVTANSGTALTYTAPVTGELAGATSATQMPSVACKLVKFKAVAANAGKVYIGVSGVTKIDGTTDTTSGFQLSPGEETGWIPIDNANRLYRICDNAGDALTYMAMN